MKIRRIFSIITILLVLIVLFMGFRVLMSSRTSERPSESVADIRAEKGIPVKVMQVEGLPWELWKRYYGRVRPSRTQDVTSFVREFVIDVPVDTGDTVTRGQVLIELSTETQAFDLSARVADYREAARDYERKKKLSEAGGISRQEVERAFVTMEQKRSLLQDVKTKVSRTKVYAKIDGIITYTDVEVGEIAEPGKRLITVADVTNLEVEVMLPPGQIDSVPPGTPVRITFNSMSCPEPSVCGGKVLRIDPEAEPNTGLYKCIVDLSLGVRIPPGSYVEAEFLVDARPSVIQLPYEIIKRENGKTFVYVVDEGRATKRYVKTGEGIDLVVEVISGLSIGEKVVTEGIDSVFDGASVWLGEDK